MVKDGSRKMQDCSGGLAATVGTVGWEQSGAQIMCQGSLEMKNSVRKEAGFKGHSERVSGFPCLLNTAVTRNDRCVFTDFFPVV